MRISEDTFHSEYKPVINHIVRAKAAPEIGDAEICSFGGSMYETYGRQESYVRGMAQDAKTKKRVWTVVDVDGELCIIAGFHFVNRFGYIITEKEWVSGGEEVENI
jgi:hypothetical protein